jgi:hypothetical protein
MVCARWQELVELLVDTLLDNSHRDGGTASGGWRGVGWRELGGGVWVKQQAGA